MLFAVCLCFTDLFLQSHIIQKCQILISTFLLIFPLFYYSTDTYGHMKNASLKVSKEIWGKIKVHCAINGVKIQTWVEGVLSGAMNNKETPPIKAPIPKEFRPKNISDGEIYCEEVSPQGLE